MASYLGSDVRPELRALDGGRPRRSRRSPQSPVSSTSRRTSCRKGRDIGRPERRASAADGRPPAPPGSAGRCGRLVWELFAGPRRDICANLRFLRSTRILIRRPPLTSRGRESQYLIVWRRVMPRAVIVGAGIGGLTAAIALKQTGWDVAVYERAPELREVGAGHHALDERGQGAAEARRGRSGRGRCRADPRRASCGRGAAGC